MTLIIDHRLILPMASRLCSPKSGSDRGPTNFLHTTSTSSSRTLPSFANEVLTKLNADDMTSDSNYKFVRYMDLAMNPAGKSALDNFAVWLLTLLGYAPRTSMTRTSVDIPLNICGEQHYAKTKRAEGHGATQRQSPHFRPTIPDGILGQDLRRHFTVTEELLPRDICLPQQLSYD